MFGYIRTDVSEMRVRENEYYRAVYCGLCRSQGKCTGQCSRFTLNYDIVFLALLRLAVNGEKIEIKKGNELVDIGISTIFIYNDISNLYS